MTQRSRRITTKLRSSLASLSILTLCWQVPAAAQSETRYYQAKLERLATATSLMVDALANATLNSACLTKTNFVKVTLGLNDDAKALAHRLRDAGIKTLDEAKTWNTCKSQAEQATMLASDMASAQTWSAQRARAKHAAMLADNEELENGLLVDHVTKAPVTSPPVKANPQVSTLLIDGVHHARGVFDGKLTVSEDGLVTACIVVSSSGSERVDRSICQRAKSLLRYRPAFADGRLVTSTTNLRIRFEK